MAYPPTTLTAHEARATPPVGIDLSDRHLLNQFPMSSSRRFSFGEREFLVARGVFDPVRHLSGISFAKYLETLDWTDQRVLDLGSGTGVLASVLHDAGAIVTATDHNPRAVRCAADNLVDTSVDVRGGDLFDPVRGEQFDTIVVNPPYVRGWSWSRNLRSHDLLERIADEWQSHGDHLLLAFPTDSMSDLANAGFDVDLTHRVSTAGRELGVFSARVEATQ